MIRAALILTLAPTLALAQTKTVNTVQSVARQAVAGAPNMQILTSGAAQSDLCIGEISGAYGNSVLAVTLDLTHRDVVCARLRQSWYLSAHGYGAAGIQLQCLSDEVRLAMKRAGTPCEAQVSSSPSPMAGP